MRTWSTALVAALLAFASAGCFGGSDGDGGPSGSPSSSTSSSSSSASGAPGGNQTGNQTARVSANLTADPLEGSAPLEVAFGLAGNASRGNLTWTLSFGDGNATNGTSLPHDVTHTYAAGGNFTAVLTVSAGGANATANVTVAVAPGAVGFAPGMDPACQRPDAVGTDEGFWVDERGGGSVWVYLEENGIPGLQVDVRPSPLPAPAGGHTDSLAEAAGCVGGDQMYF